MNFFRILALFNVFKSGSKGRRQGKGGISMMLIIAGVYYAQTRGWLPKKGDSPREPAAREAPALPPSAHVPLAISAACTKVIDGDTIEIKESGKPAQRVRIQGIDCPETYNEEKALLQSRTWKLSKEEVMAIGEEAKHWVNSRLAGKKVELVLPGAAPELDPYHRLLAYVEIQGEDVGEGLLKAGLAEARREPHPRKKAYENWEAQARNNKQGVFKAL